LKSRFCSIRNGFFVARVPVKLGLSNQLKTKVGRGTGKPFAIAEAFDIELSKLLQPDLTPHTPSAAPTTPRWACFASLNAFLSNLDRHGRNVLLGPQLTGQGRGATMPFYIKLCERHNYEDFIKIHKS
jgi:hypothetical protein